MNTNRKILFLILFTVLGFLAFQLPISKIIGSGQSFTLFELLGPVGGMFLGSWLGALSAGIVYAVNTFIFHKSLSFLSLALLLPPMLAAAYFGIKSKKTAIIFPICIALFLLNPIGRQAWLYSFIWIIPFIASFWKKRLIFNSLGATFTAHAVGSVFYLYMFGLTPAIWMGLIPVVFLERGVFTIGIFVSCFAFNFVLDKVTNFKFASSLKPFVKTELLINAGTRN